MDRSWRQVLLTIVHRTSFWLGLSQTLLSQHATNSLHQLSCNAQADSRISYAAFQWLIASALQCGVTVYDYSHIGWNLTAAHKELLTSALAVCMFKRALINLLSSPSASA